MNGLGLGSQASHPGGARQSRVLCPDWRGYRLSGFFNLTYTVWLHEYIY